ncbi:hypothetical protein MEQU1_002543 [Malassezia equina]|uniref:Uncharacterized protein n=1 Tax=Malassezia equina TaxID=1381935 RepID=A0AAF0EF52_9BASI|nr:hypothetical protein MEQU1_002543 [Malassezia equina]
MGASESKPEGESLAWSQISNEKDAQPSLLGLTLRLCNPMDTISHTWHILDVVEGSPADSAGLVPFGDYIIGWTGGPLQGEGDFFQLVEQSANTNLSLYVYNSDYDHTREVVIQWEDSVLEATESEPDSSSLAPPVPMHHPSNAYETSYDGFEPEDTYNFGVTVSMHEDEEE